MANRAYKDIHQINIQQLLILVENSLYLPEAGYSDPTTSANKFRNS